MNASSGNRPGIVGARYRDDPRWRGLKAVQATCVAVLTAVPGLLPCRRRRRVDGARQRAWPNGRFSFANLATPEGNFHKWCRTAATQLTPPPFKTQRPFKPAGAFGIVR